MKASALLLKISTTALLLLLAVPPGATAPVAGELSALLLEAEGNTSTSGAFGLLRLRHETTTAPLAAPNFNLEASRIRIEGDTADYFVLGTHHIQEPETRLIYEGESATLQGTENRPGHRLWIVPLEGHDAPTLEIDSTHALVSRHTRTEAVLEPEVSPTRGDHITNTTLYGAWSADREVRATIQGSFLIVTWEWDALLAADGNQVAIASGVQGPAAEHGAGSAQEVWTVAYDATLAITLRPDTYNLYLDGARLLADGTVRFPDARGTLSGISDRINDDLELRGVIDVAVTSQERNEPLKAVVAGDVDEASLGGEALALPVPAPTGEAQNVPAWMSIALIALVLVGSAGAPEAWYWTTRGAYGAMQPVQAHGWHQRRAVGLWGLAVRLYTLRLRRLAAWLAQRSLHHWPGFARPHLTLGDYALHNRDYPDAREYYRAAMGRFTDPESKGIPMSCIVACELRLGSYQDALLWLKRTHRVNLSAAKEAANDPLWGSNPPPLVRLIRAT